MTLKLLLILGTALSLCSCHKKTKALLSEYEDQQAEIVDLESQIQRLNRKLVENQIEDPSKRIEEQTKQLVEIQGENEVLRETLEAIKAETKKEAEKLEQYRIKYSIKTN